MIIINILLLNFLIQLISCEDDRSCNFDEPQTISNIAEQMAKPSKGLLNKFGFEFDLSDTFGIDLSDQGIDANQYFYDATSFGAIFLVFFVILYLYFLIFLITNCCCCCHAKNSKKPKALHIIFHYLGIILLIVSAILIFLSSKNVLKAIENVKNFPSNLNNEIDGIFNQLNSTISNTFDSIEHNVDNFIGVLNNFTNWLNASSKANNVSAHTVIPDIVEYNNTFADPDKKYMMDYVNLQNELKSSEQKDLLFSLELMNSSRQPAIDTIVNLSGTLIDATGEISETVDNIQDTIDKSINDVKNQIEKFRNEEISKQIDDIKESIDGSSLDLDTIEDLCKTLSPILKYAFYAIAAFILLISVLYAIIFFCHNCCSRLTACCFPLCGILLTIIVILPGCIFAIAFVVFNDLCPELEATLSSILSSSDGDDSSSYKTLLYHNAFINKNNGKFYLAHQLESPTDLFTNLTEMLLCQNNTPLLDLIDVGFNTTDIINDFRDQFGESFDLRIPNELKDKLDNFAENFDVEKNISSNYILFNHTETLPAIQKVSHKTEEYAGSMSNIINEKETVLDGIRQLMRNITEFGSSIVPEAEDLNNQTKQLIDNLIDDTDSTLNGGLDSITCMSFRCVYSPFKNLLCVDLLAGLAFWVFSTVLTIIALAILSITICRRRRSMASSKIQNASDSESAESINEFND